VEHRLRPRRALVGAVDEVVSVECKLKGRPRSQPAAQLSSAARPKWIFARRTAARIGVEC